MAGRAAAAEEEEENFFPRSCGRCTVLRVPDQIADVSVLLLVDARCLRCAFYCAASAGCGCYPHERLTIAVELATALTHSAQRPRLVVEESREGEVGEAYGAPRRLEPPLSGTRLEQLVEPAGTQRSDRTVQHFPCVAEAHSHDLRSSAAVEVLQRSSSTVLRRLPLQHGWKVDVELLRLRLNRLPASQLLVALPSCRRRWR